MTCGIWKRSLPPSGFIILPQPGKPRGCPRLRGPLAPSPAAAGEQGEGLRWLGGHTGGLWQSWGRAVGKARAAKLAPLGARGSVWLSPASPCSLLPLCSLSRGSRLLRCPRSARLQKGNAPLPCFTCSILGVGWLGSALPCRCSPPPRQN